MAKAEKKLIIAMVATGLLCCGACTFLSRAHSSGTVFIAFLASCALLLCEYMSAKLFFFDERQSVFNLTGVKGLTVIAAISLIVGLLLELGTLIGAPVASPFNPSDWNAKRIVLFSFMVFGGILFRNWYWGRERPGTVKKEILELRDAISRKTAIAACSVFAILLLLGLLINSFSNLSPKVIIGFFAAVAFSAAGIIILHRVNGNHPEYTFLVAALAFGTYLVLIIPPITVISWDDQTHYSNSVSLSYVFDVEASDAEETIRDPDRLANERAGYPTTLPSSDGEGIKWDEDVIEEYADHLDSEIESQGYRPFDEGYIPVSYLSFGYIPSALGFWIARLFNLPFTVVFAFGKWFNLLFYALICFVAIRILPVKKTLFAVLALLPTELFLASNYSYDPWVACMLGLAVAMIIREIYNRETILNPKRFIAIAIAFIVGLGPKALYFPLIGLLFLMPRSKFSSRKQHRNYIIATIIIALIVLCSFAIPFLLTSGGAGDTRGGANIGPADQVRFMLDNPFEAFTIFANFIFGQYLSLPASDNYTMFFAYLGNARSWIPWMSCLPLTYILLVAIGENYSKETIGRIGGKIWTAFVCFVVVVLFALALYIAYTPVGLNTINGVQERYLVPLLFPFFAICSSLPFVSKIRPSLFSGIALSCSILLLCITVFANVTQHIFS